MSGELVPARTMFTPKMEAFCQHYVISNDSIEAYREAYDAEDMGPQTVRNESYRLRSRPDVAARVNELRAAVLNRTMVTIQQQLYEAAEMAVADVSEVSWIEHRPCADCHKLYDADLFAGRPLPDISRPLEPHPDCAAGRAHQRVMMRPMDEWSPAVRKLYDGMTMLKDGTLVPSFRDRSQLSDMVNRLLGGYVSRSVNINATVDVPKLTDMSDADALEFIRSLSPS